MLPVHNTSVSKDIFYLKSEGFCHITEKQNMKISPHCEENKNSNPHL